MEMTNSLNVEQALRAVTERASVLRYLSDSASTSKSADMDSIVLSSMGTMCGEIEQLIARVRGALGLDALETEVPLNGRR